MSRDRRELVIKPFESWTIHTPGGTLIIQTDGEWTKTEFCNYDRIDIAREEWVVEMITEDCGDFR